MRLVYQRLNRTVGTDIVPAPLPGEHDLDTWYFRTEGEAGYGEKLMKLDYSRFRGVVDVRQDALCFDRPLLRAEFRYHKEERLGTVLGFDSLGASRSMSSRNPSTVPNGRS